MARFDGLIVRPSTTADLGAVHRIYSHEVLHGIVSFETDPPTAKELARRRSGILARGLPHVVAELEGDIAGYAYAGPYRTRPAYGATVEDSVYVAQGFQGRGIGRALLTRVIEDCEAGPWRQMVAIIGDSANVASIALHRKLGFRDVGVLESVGFKNGRWVDTVMMQRSLGDGNDTPPEEALVSG